MGAAPQGGAGAEPAPLLEAQAVHRSDATADRPDASGVHALDNEPSLAEIPRALAGGVFPGSCRAPSGEEASSRMSGGAALPLISVGTNLMETEVRAVLGR